MSARRHLVVVATLVLLGSAGAVRAQPDAGRPPSLPMLLQLRPDQRGAWRDYRDELAQERADAEADRHELEQVNAMTTPQRLDWRLAQAPRIRARERRQAAATLAFYQALLPDQRERFDAATRTQIPPPPIRQGQGHGGEPQTALARPPAGDMQDLPRP